jgi:hypothetical protein
VTKTREELKAAAISVIRGCGWKAGDRLSLHSVSELMVALAWQLQDNLDEDVEVTVLKKAARVARDFGDEEFRTGEKGFIRGVAYASESIALAIEDLSGSDLDSPDVTEQLRDRVEGLEADLDSAVAVAWCRGAIDWVKLNYPSHAARLEETFPSAGVEYEYLPRGRLT